MLRVGIDLSRGGAFSYLSASGSSASVVDTSDPGRYVQQSYYGGPDPFLPPGATQHPPYPGWGWNPVQAGDVYDDRSLVTERSNDRDTTRYGARHQELPAIPTGGTLYRLFAYTGDLALPPSAAISGRPRRWCRTASARIVLLRCPVFGFLPCGRQAFRAWRPEEEAGKETQTRHFASTIFFGSTPPAALSFTRYRPAGRGSPESSRPFHSTPRAAA